MTNDYVGRRLSFDGARCTVRYYGPVDGTRGDWLGVEWDDSQGRGKHDGSHQSKRYFRCLSDSSTAASFIRPSRPRDKPLSFLNALQKKYAANGDDGSTLLEEQIRISGKTVEEVGFDKIRQQLASLQALRIVILDCLCINGIENYAGDKTLGEWHHIRSQGLSIVELDLSRNLFEQWSDVVGICTALQAGSLRSLKLDANSFRDLTWPSVPQWVNPFQNLVELSMSAMHVTWQDIVRLLPQFSSLAILNVSSNGLSTLEVPLPAPFLTTLDLSSNNITSLWDLIPLDSLSRLERLSLRRSPISTLLPTIQKADSHPPSFSKLRFLDMASTLFPTLASLDLIPTVFPALTSLLTTDAPLTEIPSSKLLTIARIPTLTELNYSPITAAERQNAELYYLSTIAKQLGASTNPAEELRIISENPRWHELCKSHGEPAIEKRSAEEAAAGTLGARVTEFTFYITEKDLRTGQTEAGSNNNDKIKVLQSLYVDGGEHIIQKSRLIPRTVDVYRLKGIVGRLFGIRPMSCKLIWETGECDPVKGQEDEGWSVSEDEDESEDGDRAPSSVPKLRKQSQEWDKTKWEQRETELVDGTREVGFWVEGKEARVRIELRWSS